MLLPSEINYLIASFLCQKPYQLMVSGEVDWGHLSCNPSEGALSLLEQNPEKIDWDWMCKYNPSDWAIRLVEQSQNIQTYGYALSQNPSDYAICFLEQNPHVIDWEEFSQNNSDKAIYLWERNLDKIDWVMLSFNPHENARRLCRKYQQPYRTFPTVPRRQEQWRDPTIFTFNPSEYATKIREMADTFPF
jgi:hypothetical protein